VLIKHWIIGSGSKPSTESVEDCCSRGFKAPDQATHYYLLMYKSREQQITDLCGEMPKYRFSQIDKALFDLENDSWDGVSTLPKDMRDKIAGQIPWLSFSVGKIYESIRHDTFKAVFETSDNKFFESVLMANKKGQWTICVSSQIGCAMRCTFCATGTMGLKRSMHSDEITDQYRFWNKFLHERAGSVQRGQVELSSHRISNVVFMGMGEPMANYENVKKAIHTWIKYTDLGPTKIMVSTVGILLQLKRLLVDPDWPGARIAISLHSANQKKREEIVPTTVPDFIKDLAAWSHEYQSKLGNRNHQITFEYTLILNVNDTPELAHELARYIRKTAVSKINVIPLNAVHGKSFVKSDRERIDIFKDILRSYDVNVTERKTMGDDIDAACGQLAIASE